MTPQPPVAQPPVLLLTRPQPQSIRFARACTGLGPHQVVIAPLTEVVALPVAPGAFDGVRGLVLTSANAVPMVANLAPIPAWCVGAATARAARAAGFTVHVAGGDAAHLAADLARDRPQGPLLHAHGADLARDLAADLAGVVDLRRVAVYAAREIPWPDGLVAGLAGRRVIAPLFSPRAAALFGARAVGLGATAVAISAACAARLPSTMAVHVARTPDQAGILDAMRALLPQVHSCP